MIQKDIRNQKIIINLLSFLSIFQFYLFHLGAIYIQIYLFVSYFLLFKSLGLRHDKTTIEKWAICLVLFQVTSLVWAKSIPTGIREVFFTLPFFASLFYSVELAKNDKRAFYEAVEFYIKCSSFHALLVVIGRVIPAIKYKFLSSPVASFFINGNALFDTNVYLTGSNILDPAKSGGFLINANVTGAWMLLAYHLALALFFVYKKKSILLIAILHLLAVILCGSKISLMCIPISVFFGLFFVNSFCLKDKLRNVSSLFVSLSLLSALISSIIIFNLTSKVPYYLVAPFEARMVTWTFGALEFLKHPWFGHGYGGWTEVFSTSGFVRLDLGLTEFSASQNMFITLWSQSGIIAVIFGLGFIFSCFKKLAVPSTNVWTTMAIVAGLFSLFLQGQGENYGVFGDVHIMHLLSLTIGFIIIISTNNPINTQKPVT